MDEKQPPPAFISASAAPIHCARSGMAWRGNVEARQQDVGQEKEEAELHGLHLAPHQRRHQQPEREARDDEGEAQQVEQREAPSIGTRKRSRPRTRMTVICA